MQTSCNQGNIESISTIDNGFGRRKDREPRISAIDAMGTLTVVSAHTLAKEPKTVGKAHEKRV